MKRTRLFTEYSHALELALVRNVQEAVAEDLGHCDYTGLLIDPDSVSQANLLCRDAAIVCGQPWFDEVFRLLDPSATLQWQVKEGDQVQANTIVCSIKGHSRALLTAERPALNFLQFLSGVATRTNQLAQLIEGSGAVLLDTRKTIPGLRLAQKYAVRVGGGKNQRLALYDGILIKENHIEAAGGTVAALERAVEVADHGVEIQIEVESVQQLQVALDAGVKLVLLDNFSLDEMREAVRVNEGRAILEASGGITEQSLCDIAATGVHRISVGALTKSIQATDYSLRVMG